MQATALVLPDRSVDALCLSLHHTVSMLGAYRQGSLADTGKHVAPQPSLDVRRPSERIKAELQLLGHRLVLSTTR